MKKIFITTGCAILVATPAYTAYNCCAKCVYDQANTACTENCCDSTGTSETSPDVNHIITITTKTNNVICAISSTGSNHVSCNIQGSCKCEKGYYGSPMYNLFTGTCTGTCERCPSSGGVYGTTASSGATSITECFIPSGSLFSDDTGAGIYDGDCYYSN